MPLNPGDRIERYIIDAALGRGGMGEVYRAHDERLQRSVALKILRIEPSSESASSKPTSDSASRMIREARAAAALDHPNVVAIYDVGQLEEPEELRGTTYLAMELIKGSTLRPYVGDARVTMKERVRWLADVARALGAAHAAGIVHRDVKPENVMIREDGRVKVLDFGVAKRTDTRIVDPTSSTEGYVVPTTVAGMVMGTPMYMAPEQLCDESLDGRTDQFAWGVVAYELLTGRFPWSTQGGAITLVSQILSTKPPPFEAGAAVSGNVVAAVTRALSKEREARFPTMDALLEVLEGPVSALAETASVASILGEKGSLAPSGSAPRVIVSRGEEPELRESPVARTPRAGRRRAALAVGAFLALAGAVTLFVARSGEHERQPATLDAARRAASGSASACTSNRACSAAHAGDAYVCRSSDHACVPVASEDCKPLYEAKDLESEDTIWLGAMFPVAGPDAAHWEEGPLNMAGADFARGEIAQALDALEGSSVSRRVRRIALAGCNDLVDPKRAALHLVDDVGVPAIMGFRSGQEILDLAGSLLIDRNVAVVVTLTSNPLITRLPQPENQPRLVWRTIYGFRSLAEATASFVHESFEPRLHGGAKTRLVLLRDDNVAGVSFADTFYRELIFNGKSALENGHDYEEIIDSKTKGSPGETARRVLEARPSIVVDLSGATTPLALAQALEDRAGASALHPIYVLPNYSTHQLASFIGSDADRRRRVFAIESLSNSTPNARFTIRYNEAKNAKVTRTLNPGATYDAFYLLAYASFALPPGSPVSGTALTGSFGRLVATGSAPPARRPIEVGPTGVFDALTILSSGGSIDLEGAESSLDFDLTTGEDSFDFELLCPAVDEHGKATSEDAETGAVYLSKTRKVAGTIKCP